MYRLLSCIVAVWDGGWYARVHVHVRVRVHQHRKTSIWARPAIGWLDTRWFAMVPLGA